MVLILLLIRDLGVVNRVQRTGILNDLQAITASNRSMTETRPQMEPRRIMCRQGPCWRTFGDQSVAHLLAALLVRCDLFLWDGKSL